MKQGGTGDVIVVVYVVTVCVDAAAVVYIRDVVLIVARRAQPPPTKTHAYNPTTVILHTYFPLTHTNSSTIATNPCF